MRDMDLKTLRLMVAVCDHQNMTPAAQRLVEHLAARAAEAEAKR
jgi:hypothetical protein